VNKRPVMWGIVLGISAVVYLVSVIAIVILILQ
jgi:hypothetical protein